MKKALMLILAAGLVFAGGAMCFAQEETLFDFSDGLQGWEIPAWAFEQPDYVQEAISRSEDFSSVAGSSLKMDVDFPGGMWAGAIVEIMQYFDWSDYSAIAVDVYLPEDAPEGLNGALILTVGDQWRWVEMSRSYSLEPGQWVTMTGDLTPGSIDWRRVQVDDAFRQDVRKIGVRAHSNQRPSYSGPIYVDNVRVIR